MGFRATQKNGRRGTSAQRITAAIRIKAEAMQGVTAEVASRAVAEEEASAEAAAVADLISTPVDNAINISKHKSDKDFG